MTSKAEDMTTSKKKRIKELQRIVDRLSKALAEDVERDVSSVVKELDRSIQSATKQTMFARVSPPDSRF